MKKKVLIILSLFVVLLFTNLPVHATTRTAKQAVSWVRKQAKHKKKFDDGQCVDLIEHYYKYLGAESTCCDGCDYAKISLPKGWKRVKGGKPKAGDIIIFKKTKSNPFGHVAIYVGKKESYHQNFNGIMHTVKCKYNIKTLSCPYWGYIRPNWGQKSSLKLSATKKTISAGKDFVLSADVVGGSVKSVSSSNKSLVYVDYLGENEYLITGRRSGTTKLTVKCSNGKTASCVVNIE